MRPLPVDDPLAADEPMLHHLLSISQALAGQLDYSSAIRAVSESLGELIRHDHYDVCMMTPDGKLHVAYETGLATGWGSRIPHPTEWSPIRSVLWGEVPYMLTPDATEDPRFRFEGALYRPIFEAYLRSRLHVPLRVQGTVIGALSCSSHDAGIYSMADVKTAQHVADLLAPYFFALRSAEQANSSAIVEAEARAREEGLRQGALRLTEELEHERQRIGMDLHDQTLAELTRLLHRLARLKEQPEVPGEALGPLEASLRASMADLRRIIDDAKPNVLHLFGFAEAMEDLLERTRQTSGNAIATMLHDDAGAAVDALSDPMKVALFRIVQEAVNNAARHAAAGEIRVCLRPVDDRIEITVSDDGAGIDRLPRRLGGIDNMRTRAQLIGAAFAIGSGPFGRGTQVSITVGMATTA